MPAIFFIVLFFSLSFGAGERCGTSRFMENLKNPQKKPLSKEYIAASSYKVQNKTTTHFIIYYMTEGPHAIGTPAYIDSLAKYLEQAYDLHTNTLGMKRIAGASVTFFYEQSVPSGRYPIEIIDTGVGGSCGTYGLTFAIDDRRPSESQIAIENDFIYGVDCPGVRKGASFTSSINGDYSQKWHLALKATVFHELYHSFQMTQYNFSAYYPDHTFWMEASATGVEEIGAPEVNDYVDYLDISNPGKSMESLKSGEEYGYATLYLFLSSELGKKFDSYIWDYFSKFPKETFAVQLARYVSLQREEGEDVEDLFHKYATHLFYSGSRATSWPYPYQPFSDDMQNWPNWRINTRTPSYLPAGTFDFVRTPNGAAPSTDSITRISSLKFGNNNDSIWVLSRLLADNFVLPPIVPPKEFAAYPNPWRPKRFEKVKFGPLPKDKKGVEIRSANGTLLKRLDRETEDKDTLTWQPEKLPAPGILYYRTLPYGKNKMLILEH